MERGFLPYARQTIDEDDVAAVEEVLRGDLLTGGPTVGRFEKALAAEVEAPYAVACATGTAALHLAALALGIGPGDQVVVPAITFLATANAVRYTGAEVVFADVDSDTGLMRCDDLEAALARADGEVKAVFPVHLNGVAAPMAGLAQAADRHGIRVVEDGCHALGTRYRDPRGVSHAVGACSHGDLTVFSFHPVKHVAMGEGGAVTTRDNDLAAHMTRLRNHGMLRDPQSWLDSDAGFDSKGEPNPWYYEQQDLGYNYRASDIHCALGLSQLKKLERLKASRRRLAEAYDQLFSLDDLRIRPMRRLADSEAALHLYPLLIDYQAFGVERSTVMRKLAERGVGTQVHYIPVHRQPYYHRRYGDIDLPGADAYYSRALSIPFFPGMSDTDATYVAETLLEILGLT